MTDQRNDDTTVLVKSGIVPAGVSSESGRAHYLLVVEGTGKGRRIAIDNKPIVIGRAPPADIVLDDSRISRSHCRVCVAFGELIVVDLESSNGTFIDGKRLTGGSPIEVGARVQLGGHVLEHEFRIRKEVEESQELDRDIEHASRYIQSLLPPPLTEGSIRTDWVLEPCARLGGDAFGYRYLDDSHFAMYLIDVSGHGAGAAMHAVSIINVLRQGALQADFRDPGSVLTALNTMFQMETHGDMYLTTWYGVYDSRAGTLAYACAGHHASYLVGPHRDAAQPLLAKHCAIGISPRTTYRSERESVVPGSVLYVFSDGVFEITTKDGNDWQLEDFVPLLLEPPVAGSSESRRLLTRVREHSKDPFLQDDFSLMAFAFQRGERAMDSTWPDRGS